MPIVEPRATAIQLPIALTPAATSRPVASACTRATIGDVQLRSRLAHIVAVNVEIQRRSAEIRGGTLAAAISMRAFLALFPIALLAIGAVGLVGGDPSTVARSLAEALGLGHQFGRTLARSVQTAEGRRVLSSVLGILGLIWTGTGLSAAIATTWDAAWSTSGGVIRGRTLGAVW